MAITRNIICAKCNGSGTKSGKGSVKCQSCEGRGVKIMIRQMGMMIQQTQSVCPECQGKGETVKDKDRCAQCGGKQVIQERKILEVQVDKGMRTDQKITFSGESDQAPGVDPGDIIFVLKQKEHPVFKRNGNDLYVEKSIKLIEALSGVAFTLQHLDNRILIVRSAPGEIIKPGDTLMVAEEGMPQHKRPFEKGNLYIRFNIIFPTPSELPPNKLKALEQLLPPRDPLPQITNMEVDEVEVVLRQPVPSSTGGAAEHGRGGYGGGYGDEEDDGQEGPGGHRVQCQQQ